MEKEKDFENRNFWEDYLQLSVLNMFENIKSIQMELDSMKYLKKEKANPNYEENRKKEIEDLRSKKMDIVKLNSVNF
jgi:L-fucose mutarotase/ribose pyranase (RbsD/FucU family)